MTKSFLVVAGCLLIAPTAWAGPPPAPQGSGNNVTAALTPEPAPAPKRPAPAPAAAQTAQAPPAPAFNASAYGSAADCMTAASAAQQPLSLCAGLKK